MASGLEVRTDSNIMAMSSDFQYPSLISVRELTTYPLVVGTYFNARNNGLWKYHITINNLSKPIFAVSLGDNRAFCCVRYEFINNTLIAELVFWTKPLPNTYYILVYDDPTTEVPGFGLYTPNREIVSDFTNLLKPRAMVSFDSNSPEGGNNTIPIKGVNDSALVIGGAGSWKEIKTYTNARPPVVSATMYHSFYYRSPSTSNLRWFNEVQWGKFASTSAVPDGIYIVSAPPMVINIEGIALT